MIYVLDDSAVPPPDCPIDQQVNDDHNNTQSEQRADNRSKEATTRLFVNKFFCIFSYT